LFNLERQFSPGGTPGIVAADSRKLSAEQQQRDVFDSHRHRVFSVAFYMTANEIEAEKILTDTFARVFSSAEPSSGQHVDQVLIDELSQRFLLDTVPSACPDPDLLLQRGSGRRTALEEALPNLPAIERLVFLLRDVEGYPAARIAPLVQLSETEVQRTAISARIRMRNELAMAQLREREREAARAREEAAEPDESYPEPPHSTADSF
jgi:RNA polymerase sigma-70 factor, ECF subfamily